MMALHDLVAVVFVSLLLWNSVHTRTLYRYGNNVCSTRISRTETYSTRQSYTSTYSVSTSCGFWGTERCTTYHYRVSYRYVTSQRTIYSLSYVCCNGYRKRYYSNECTEPICMPECGIHGTCTRPNWCTCADGYHGPRCQYTCNSNVDNCENIDCTSRYDSRCTRCLYHRTNKIKAYDLVSGKCKELCSWRSNSKSCYPGTCESTPDTCICDVEFNGDDNCMAIIVRPTVTDCSISLQGNGTSSSDMPCQQSTSPSAYSSVGGNALSVNWQTRFSGPSPDKYPFPYYVDEYKVGVTSAVVNWVLNRGDIDIDTGDIDCELNHNRDDPNQDLHSCSKCVNLGEQLQNGDSLKITASSSNGGFLRLNNYDYSSSGIVGAPAYYKGKTVTMYLKVTVDLEAPTHCSLTVPRDSICNGNVLDIGDPYTKSSEVEIHWSTWEDYISGLTPHPYECRVYRMVAKNGALHVDDDGAILNYSRSGGDYRAKLESHTLPGVYCVVLAVDDVAGNTRYARRCFIFDDQSEISIVVDKPIHLTVVGNQSSDVLITGDTNVTLSWQGHFVNQLHVNHSMLLAINVNDDVMNEAYDSDAPPTGRPLLAIDNRNGIIKFEFGVAKDKLGGATFVSFEPDWKPLSNDLDEMVVIKLENAEDGDTFGFWVRTTDVVGNTKADFISIDIDSPTPTPPTPTLVDSVVLYSSVAGSVVLVLFVILFCVVHRHNQNHQGRNKPVPANLPLPDGQTVDQDFYMAYKPVDCDENYQSILPHGQCVDQDHMVYKTDDCDGENVYQSTLPHGQRVDQDHMVYKTDDCDGENVYQNTLPEGQYVNHQDRYIVNKTVDCDDKNVYEIPLPHEQRVMFKTVDCDDENVYQNVDAESCM